MAWPNEPTGTGYSLISDFDCSVNPPATNVEIGTTGWYISNAASITKQSDVTAPQTPNDIYRWFYGIGFPGDGFGPGSIYRLLNNTTLYAGFWWKPCDPWQDHSTGVNKFVFVFGSDGHDMYLFHEPGSPRHVIVNFQWGGVADEREPNVTTTAVVLGQWHQIELLLDVPNGTAKFWVNGVLNGNYTGVNYPAVLTEFTVSPTWGGVGFPGEQKDIDDYYDYDHFRLSVPGETEEAPQAPLIMGQIVL
jgi:hypothetical protein